MRVQVEWLERYTRARVTKGRLWWKKSAIVVWANLENGQPHAGPGESHWNFGWMYDGTTVKVPVSTTRKDLCDLLKAEEKKDRAREAAELDAGYWHKTSDFPEATVVTVITGLVCLASILTPWIIVACVLHG